MKKTIGLGIGIVMLAIGCSKSSKEEEPPIDCATFTTTFAANVAPLIASSCAKSNCHATGSINGPGALTTYKQIFDARDQIRQAVVSGYMPEDATFSAQQKATITCWIDGGAPNN